MHNSASVSPRVTGTQALVRCSTPLVMYFLGLGIWWPFFQIWLTGTLGFTSIQVGTIFSINAVIALIFMLVYGTLQDRLGFKRRLVILIGLFGCLIGPLMNYAYEPLLKWNFYLGAICASIVICAGFSASCGIVEAFTERMSRFSHFPYGLARACGSFSYALMALVGGFTLSINPVINFWMASIFSALMVLAYIFVCPRLSRVEIKETTQEYQVKHHEDQVTAKNTIKLLSSKSVWIIILFVLLATPFYNLFDQQMFPSFYASLFSDASTGTRAYGILNSIQIFGESVITALFPVIVKKFGVRKTLLTGVFLTFLIPLGCALFPHPASVFFFKFLQAAQVPLFNISLLGYFTLHFNPRFSATLYMVAFQISAQIGQAVVSTPLGFLRDCTNYQITFTVIAIVIACAVTLGYFALKKDNVDVYANTNQ